MANCITVAGRLGHDAEIRYLPDGTSVTSFSVADDQYAGKDNRKTTWWSCSFFGQRGEAVAQYLTKGSSVTVFGEASLDSFVGKDGLERTTGRVRVNNVALQGGGTTAITMPASSTPPDPSARRPAASKPMAASNQTPTPIDDIDDDIPF